MSHCPCGHQKDFSECCEPLHQGSRQAATAEELMRSRYSAFVKGSVDYIIETNHADTRGEINREEVEQWSKASEWKGLEIVKTEAGSDSDDKGMVEFRANYTVEGKTVVHHEKADFTKEDDRWYFVDGEILREAYRREHPKVGRNDPCFCGSGKKYKKCCYLTL